MIIEIKQERKVRKYFQVIVLWKPISILMLYAALLTRALSFKRFSKYAPNNKSGFKNMV